MFTPFDTAHMTHRAACHVPADAATRAANRQLRMAQRAARRSLVARLLGLLARNGAVRTAVSPRV